VHLQRDDPNFCCEDDPSIIGRRTLEEEMTYDEKDSVYESTYQDMDARQHPLIRCVKLKKRIQRDAKMSLQERKQLVTRHNLICHRIKRDHR